MGSLNMIKSFVAVCVLFFSTAGAAFAAPGPSWIPPFRPGQYVYTVPEGFDPPLVGKVGIEALQAAAVEAHFPFYTVFIKELPTSRRSQEENAANIVDGIAEGWTGVEGFDPAVSQIFLLSYEPRQYRFLAGAKFKVELRFEREAHKPYTAHFERAVRGTPKDPLGGILKTLRSVDDYLFDQTDPARIAAREEAARVLSEHRRLESARGNLDHEIQWLARLLEEEEYLPLDVTSYRDLLKDARAVRTTQKDNPGAMAAFAGSMNSSTQVLAGAVGVAKSAARAKLVVLTMKVLFGLVLLCLVLVWLILRYQRFVSTRDRFRKDVAAWRDSLKAAFGRYYDLYGERDSVLALDDLTGASAALYAKVTTALDAIVLSLRALEAHVEAVATRGGKGGFVRFGTLVDAHDDLDTSFTFDTEVVNRDELFGPPTKTLTVRPTDFLRDLERAFKDILEDWQHLKIVADARMLSAAEHFPQTGLDALLERADGARIPRRWLQDHPLFGDETSDASLWAGAEALRFVDPVAFMARIAEWRAKEVEVAERLTRLEAALVSAKVGEGVKLPVTGNLVLDPADDPSLTYDVAMREEDKLLGRLAGAQTVEEVEEKAQQVAALKQKCREQVGAVEHVAQRLKEAKERNEAAIKSAEGAAVVAATRATLAAPVHANSKGMTYLHDGERYMQAATEAKGRALSATDGKRLLAAARLWEESTGLYEKARETFAQTVKHVDALDAQKAEYERKVAEAESRRAAAAQKIRGYGGSVGLDSYAHPGGLGALDYAALLLIYDAHAQRWADAERRARRDYEAAEAAKREAEAQARRAKERRRAAAYAASSRRSSYSSSSSGSDWGGGSSSSSGGGWGGGGSSSSGGGW